MNEPPGFSNRQLISTIGLDTFHSELRVSYQNTYSGTKSLNIMTDWSSWSWWMTVSLVIRCQMGFIIARMHIEHRCVRERNNNIFPRRILDSRTTKLPNFKEPICHFSWIWSHLCVILGIMNLILTDETTIPLIQSWRTEIWMRPTGFCEMWDLVTECTSIWSFARIQSPYLS
jgi:hypothetical protein